jgi:hypothetical protein
MDNECLTNLAYKISGLEAAIQYLDQVRAHPGAIATSSSVYLHAMSRLEQAAREVVTAAKSPIKPN